MWATILPTMRHDGRTSIPPEHPAARAAWSEGGPEPTPPAPPRRWSRRPAHLRKSSSGGAKHAGGHRRELYPGILEHLLRTLDLPCALLDLRLAVAGEVPKLPDLSRRHKARTHKPVLYQLADPLSVLDVGLPAGNVLEVPGVEKPQLEVVFEHVVDGLPVDPGSFHAHQPHLKGSQPVPEHQEHGILEVTSIPEEIRIRLPTPSL